MDSAPGAAGTLSLRLSGVRGDLRASSAVRVVAELPQEGCLTTDAVPAGQVGPGRGLCQTLAMAMRLLQLTCLYVLISCLYM